MFARSVFPASVFPPSIFPGQASGAAPQPAPVVEYGTDGAADDARANARKRRANNQRVVFGVIKGFIQQEDQWPL